MPVIAYCVLQYPTHTLHEHPDWRMRDKEGNPIERVCFNSPYIGYVKQLLAEMMTYGIDGFHLDMVDQGLDRRMVAGASIARRKYKAKHGKAMPKAMSWDADWERMMEFRYDSSAEFRKGAGTLYQRDLAGHFGRFQLPWQPTLLFEVGQGPCSTG